MKRTRHTNVVDTPKENTAPQSNRVIANQDSTELVMKDANGKLIKAEGVKLNSAFIALSQRLMKEKGVSKASAEAIAKSVTVWTPDMVGKEIDEQPKKKVTRKKKSDDDTKAEKKPRKSKKTTAEETAPKKTRKKKTE